MKHIGRETPIEVGGKRFILSRYTRRLLAEFLDWAEGQLGNPVAEVRELLEGFPVHLQETIVDEAVRQAGLRSSVYSPYVQALWQSVQGRVFELGLLLRKYHPTEDPEGLYVAACLEHGDDYIPSAVVSCMGRMPVDPSESERQYLERAGRLRPSVDLGAVLNTVKPGEDRRLSFGPPEDREVSENWLDIDKALIKHFNLRPWDLDELTMTEIMVLFASLAEKKQEGIDLAALDQADAYRRLSPSEKLDLALLQFGG